MLYCLAHVTVDSTTWTPHTRSPRSRGVAEAAGATEVFADAVGELAIAAGRLGYSDEALRHAKRAVDVAETLDATARLHALHNLGDVHGMAGRVDEARVTLRRAAAEANQVGHAIAEMYIWHNLGWFEIAEREFETARAALSHAMDLNRRIVDHNIASGGLLGLGYAELGLGNTLDARSHFAAMLDLVLATPTPIPPDLANAAYGIALAADPARSQESDQLRLDVTAWREAEGLGFDVELHAVEAEFAERLDRGGAPGGSATERCWRSRMWSGSRDRSSMVAETNTRVAFRLHGRRRLTHAAASGILGRLMAHTTLSWKMCMRGRPRRAEDGRRDFPR